MHWTKKNRKTAIKTKNQRLNSRKPANRGRHQNRKTAVFKWRKPNQTLAKSAKPKIPTPPSYMGDLLSYLDNLLFLRELLIPLLGSHCTSNSFSIVGLQCLRVWIVLLILVVILWRTTRDTKMASICHVLEKILGEAMCLLSWYHCLKLFISGDTWHLAMLFWSKP